MIKTIVETSKKISSRGRLKLIELIFLFSFNKGGGKNVL